MSAIRFSDLPDHARLWIFGASEPLSEAQARDLRAHVDAFVEGWLAHGEPVVGAHDLRYDRFLLVAADEEATGVSGCSTDTLFRTLKESEKELGVSLVDSTLVFYRDPDGAVRALPRPEFRERVAAGDLDASTTVFDNTARTFGELREGRWELPMRDSWHARAFLR